MGIRAKQLLTGTFDATTAGRAPFGSGLFDATLSGTVFAAGAIPGSKLASAGVTETQLASTAFGSGLTGGSGSVVSVQPNVTDGSGVPGVEVAANGLRLSAAAAGAGLAGGAGDALSIGAGTGITVNANDVAINTASTVTFGASSAWTFPNGVTAQGLFVTGSPVDANHVVNKSYADSLVSGLQWKDPVHVREMIGSDAALDIEGFSPATGDAYVIDTANGAGALSAAVVGDIWEWSGSVWNLILAGSGGFVAAGARGLASIQTALNGTIGLVDATDDGKILEWDGTSLTPAKTTSLAGDALLVTDQDNDGDSVFANLGYTFQGAVPTGTWTQFTGAGQINAGAGISKTGNTLNVGDINRGVQVNTDDLELDASEAAHTSGGLEASANSWQLKVKPDVTTGANTQPVTVAANGVGLDVSAIAGTGIEADGSANLRLATQGNGITGGGGTTLSVLADVTTGANIQPVNVVANGVGLDIAAIAGTNLEADGSANLRIAAAAAGAGLTGGGASALAVGAGVGITVNASDVAVNPAALITAGAAEIDGDQLDIDFTPANYTPDTGPAEVTNVDHLSAHLKGIDNAIGAAGGTARQESVTTQAITGTDTALTDTLDNTPSGAASLRLFLNGVFQVQGAGNDYTVSGTTITWLASTGTAVDMDGSDVLTALYES